MLNWVIDTALRYRLAVLCLVLAGAVAGAFSLTQLDIDAFPDTTPVQVQINTIVPALSPAEVEQQVTYPIEQALSGLPKLEAVRSVSKSGFSQVTVLFEDGVDLYFARQVINERLATVELPAGLSRPTLGPISTGLGEVLHYIVTSDSKDPTDARTVQDWVIKPQLRKVRGVAEINGWGGYRRQYQVRLDPAQLTNYHLTFDQVVAALEQNNRNAGGGLVYRGGSAVLVHGIGRVENREQIENIQVDAHRGTPVRIRDVGKVELGHEIRLGAVTCDGRGEAVLGLGFTLVGENTNRVTSDLKSKLEEVKTKLPPQAKVETVYDRTELIHFVIDTVRKNLFEGGLLVVAVLFAFLGRLRAAMIVALAIPLSMLFAFSGMLRFGIAASLLSLGAIDFGMIVDSSVVMVENCVRKLADPNDRRSRREIVRDAAVEVRKPTLFGELIILVVYLPILTLEGADGKLYRPMALTVIFALAGSMFLSLTLMPVLASYLLPRRTEEREPMLIRAAKAVYAPVLRLAMRWKLAVVAFAIGAFVISIMILFNLGRERVPKLSEGAIAINLVRLPGTSLEESIHANTQLERTVLKAFPDEVKHIWCRIGAAEVVTDPMGIELTDVYMTLYPREQWKKARTQGELKDRIEKELRDQLGHQANWSQPIEMRLEEITTGVRAQVAVQIFGDDLEVLQRKGAEVAEVLRTVPGNDDVTVERLTGQPVLQIKIDRGATARYGISARAILDLVESIGGKPIGDVVEGQMRFGLVVRLPERLTAQPDALRNLLITAPSGEQVPLGRLASIDDVEGPSTISREWGRRRINVTCNVDDRDLIGFVDEAKKKLAAVELPPGGRYHWEIGGEYENTIRAGERFIVVLAIAIVLIVVLLYLSYRNIGDTLRSIPCILFAWIGGILALWLRGMPLSIPAGVGFVALSGVAVLDNMILVSTIRQLRSRGMKLDQAVEQAALIRLRPVLMTTLVAAFGFVPMAFSTGVGAEVQRPLATVVIGGVLSAMVMSLLVLRVLYVVLHWPGKEHEEALSAHAALSGDQLEANGAPAGKAVGEVVTDKE
jgi:cobalt-zinc-cadmium resistance protein CzcA